MKLLLGATLLLMASVGGCVTLDTPGYSAQDRYLMITRNYVYEQEIFNDDIDRILMLRPASNMSMWNVVHRD